MNGGKRLLGRHSPTHLMRSSLYYPSLAILATVPLFSIHGDAPRFGEVSVLLLDSDALVADGSTDDWD